MRPRSVPFTLPPVEEVPGTLSCCSLCGAIGTRCHTPRIANPYQRVIEPVTWTIGVECARGHHHHTEA
jgi:hypothetical protein